MLVGIQLWSSVHLQLPFLIEVVEDLFPCFNVVPHPPRSRFLLAFLDGPIPAQPLVNLSEVISSVSIVVIGRVDNVVELLVGTNATAVFIPVRPLCMSSMSPPPYARTDWYNSFPMTFPMGCRRLFVGYRQCR